MKPIARVVLESTARRMSINGTVLPLTTVEYEILSRLTEAAGTIIAREQLIAEVFARQFNPEDRSLDVHIHRLRKKLGPHGWLLVTIRGSGHMLRSFAPANRDVAADAPAAHADHAHLRRGDTIAVTNVHEPLRGTVRP